MEIKWSGHGILTEQSDWRAHVCPLGRTNQRAIWFFPTKSGKQAALDNRHKWKTAGQAGVKGPTGLGPRVPPEEIEGAIACHPPGWIWWLEPWAWNMKDRGGAAERTVRQVLESGYVPTALPFCLPQAEDLKVRHTPRSFDWDFELRRGRGVIRLQVKADLPSIKFGGLYLQVDERNPLKRFT